MSGKLSITPITSNEVFCIRIFSPIFKSRLFFVVLSIKIESDFVLSKLSEFGGSTFTFPRSG